MKPPMTRYNTMTRFLIHLADMVPDSVLGIPHRFPPVKSLEIRGLNISGEQTAACVRDNGKRTGADLKRRTMPQ
jgi:hypothetical protein